MNNTNRRKAKENPYTIYKENDKQFVNFKDGKNIECMVEVSIAVYCAMDRFELEDERYNNERKRRLDKSELTENLIHRQASLDLKSVDDIVAENIRNEKLHRAIEKLPKAQRRRLILYYFEGYKYVEIAKIEGCSEQAISKSIIAAEKNLKKFLSKGL